MTATSDLAPKRKPTPRLRPLGAEPDDPALIWKMFFAGLAAGFGIALAGALSAIRLLIGGGA